MLRRWLPLVLAVLVLVLPRAARADKSTAHSLAVAVLSFDSDDADEQADALTGALRSRVRASQGWSLVDTTQPLGMLTAALRCPGKSVPAECQQRISEQIKAERYVFGYVTKGPKVGEVTAEIHLYQKSKPETVLRETYAENLKDQNDDTLRKVAQRALDRLGSTALGTIVVRFGTETGEVVLDGDKHVPLSGGAARLELSPGSHSVEVTATGRPAQKRTVLVTAGKETLVELSAVAAPAPASKPSGPFPTRKVVGGGLAAVGVVAGIFSVVNLLAYMEDQDEGDRLQNEPNPNIVKLPPKKTASDACGNEMDPNSDICRKNDDAKRHSTIALISGIGAGAFLAAGAYLLLTDGSSDQEKAASSKKVRAVPSLGQGYGGVSLVGRF